MSGDGLVKRLAEALDHETWCNRGSADLDDDDLACVGNRLATVRPLLPVVEAECRRRAAEAIEPFVALADEMERQITFRRETNENDPTAAVRETDLRWLRLAIHNARQP